MEDPLDSGQDGVPLLQVSICDILNQLYLTWHLAPYRYWVITVVPYLLYCFVVNHSRETCERIYKVGPALWLIAPY